MEKSFLSKNERKMFAQERERIKSTGMANSPTTDSLSFREGQDVEVCATHHAIASMTYWRKAKILTVSRSNMIPQTVSVIFPDGTSGVFDVEYIRTF
jgi:hypothetical protein